MHISKNLLFSLNEARSALAAGGWLVIGECVRPYDNQPMYPELMFQILESFTNVETDPEIRPNPGFLTAEQWRRAFSRAGFTRDGDCAGYRANPRDLPAFFHRRNLRTKHGNRKMISEILEPQAFGSRSLGGPAGARHTGFAASDRLDRDADRAAAGKAAVISRSQLIL